MFSEVPNANVILHSRQGYYVECKVFSMRNELFAKIGGRYLRLYRNRTSNSGMTVTYMDIPNSKPDALDRMILQHA